MSLTIHCYESRSVPRQASLVLDEPKPFSVYALQDNLSEDVRDLRSTILRDIEDNPPPQCTLLFELEVRAARQGELPTLKVSKLGAGNEIYVLRRDSRGRVTKGHDLKSGSRFEATLRDLRTIVFNLEIESELAHGKSALAGSRKAGSGAVDGMGSVLWIVPNIAETIAEPRAKLVAWLVQRAKKMGLTPAMISPTLLLSAVAVGGAYAWWNAAAENEALEARIAEAEEQLNGAHLARDAALSSEQDCREQRRDLTEVLDQIEESRKLQAEISLQVPLAHAVAIEGGGARMASEEALEFDGPAKASVHKMVVGEMSGAREPKNLAAVCLAQENALGQDLPPYVLTWNPSGEFLCPEDFQMVIDGVDVGGPWGLSKRVQRDFGAIADGGGDVRFNERWSSEALATGLRDVMATILDADTGDRPPVAPSQIHLWTLAMFDAYNRMPSPAGGAMDRPAVECVDEALGELARRYQPAEPGQPVLPNIADVAAGEEIRVTPSSGCPWPADSINRGAAASLRAVTQAALIELTINEGGGDEEEG